MKKLMFSAVALVAFSFTSMANNEGKEVEVKETNKASTDTDCKVEKLKAYNDMRSAGISHEDASAGSYAIYFMCLRTKTVVSF